MTSVDDIDLSKRDKIYESYNEYQSNRNSTNNNDLPNVYNAGLSYGLSNQAITTEKSLLKNNHATSQ